MGNRRRSASENEGSENERDNDDTSSRSGEENDAGSQKKVESAKASRGEPKNSSRRSDQREARKDPAHVPRAGVFFVHDDRDGGRNDGRDSNRGGGRLTKKKPSDDNWSHDKFQEDQGDDRRPSRGSRKSGTSLTPVKSERPPREDSRSFGIRNEDIVAMNLGTPTVRRTASPEMAQASDKPFIKTVVRSETPPKEEPAPRTRPERRERDTNRDNREARREPREPKESQPHRESNNRDAQRTGERDRERREGRDGRNSRNPRSEPAYHLSASTAPVRSKQERPLRERTERGEPRGPPAIQHGADVVSTNKIKSAMGLHTTSSTPSATPSTSYVVTAPIEPSRPSAQASAPAAAQQQEWKSTRSADKPRSSQDARQQHSEVRQVPQQTGAAPVALPPAPIVAAPVPLPASPPKNPPGLDVPSLKATARSFEPTTPSPRGGGAHESAEPSTAYPRTPSQYAAYQEPYSAAAAADTSADKYAKKPQQPMSTMYGGEYSAAQQSQYAMDAYGNAVPVMYSGYSGSVYPDGYGSSGGYSDGVVYGDSGAIYAAQSAAMYANQGGLWYGAPSDSQGMMPPQGTVYYPPPPPVASPAAGYYSASPANNH